MFDFDADNVTLRNQLNNDYLNLPPLEEKIVQLFSVIYESVNRTSFLACLNAIGGHDYNHKSLVSSTLKPYLDKLLAAGLLIQEQGEEHNAIPY